VPDAVLAPNAALRFTPPAAVPSPGGFTILPRPPGLGRRDRSAEKAGPRLWTLSGEDLVPVEVALGATDGRHTVIERGDIAPGTPVIVDLATN
jgi:HlyD family secretion protein